MPAPLTPIAWLAHYPLQPDEQLYAVLGNASDAKPLAAWQATAAAKMPRPIWAGTAYADWDEVMPCVGIVEPGSAFLDWIATTQATDWGWLAGGLIQPAGGGDRAFAGLDPGVPAGKPAGVFAFLGRRAPFADVAVIRRRGGARVAGVSALPGQRPAAVRGDRVSRCGPSQPLVASSGVLADAHGPAVTAGACRQPAAMAPGAAS